MESNKGITLAALVITIIVTLILAGTATYVGYDAIQTSNEQRFLSQLKEVNEAVNLHTEDYKELGLVQLETGVTFNDNSYNYKLESKEDYEKIGLSNVEDTIYVNFDTGQIYSENGINGKHTLKDFGVEYYKPIQENITEQNNISFEINLEPQQYSWKYIVNDSSIICNGNAQEGNLFYSEYIDGINHSWKRVERVSDGFALEIKQPGIYEIKFRDSLGNESDVKQVYAYVKDGLQLYYDGEYNENYKHNSEATTWTDLSGNGNNALITLSEYIKWIDNGLYVKNASSMIKIDDNGIVNIINGDKFTIQFIIDNYEYVNNSTYPTFLWSSNDNFAFFTNGNEWDYFQLKIGSNPRPNISKANLENNVIMIRFNLLENYVELWNNNNIISSANVTSKLNINNFNINSEQGANTFFMKELKVYNRTLSEEEIAANCAIDKIRYNISE